MAERVNDRITPTVDLAGLARSSERELDAAPKSDIRRLAPMTAVPWLMMTLDQLRELPIDPPAAFLVSLVDGQCTVEMIADVAAMPRQDVARTFAMLAELGAVELRST